MHRALLANMVGAARALQPISRMHSRRFFRAYENAAMSRRRFSFQGSYNKQGGYYAKGSRAQTAGGTMGKVLMYFLAATGAVVWAVQLGEVAVFYYFPDRWVTTRFTLLHGLLVVGRSSGSGLAFDCSPSRPCACCPFVGVATGTKRSWRMS